MRSFSYVDGEYEVKSEIKRSLFIATVKGEVDAEGAEEFVRSVRKKYSDATHNCYAYISDELGNGTRFSDDGEPGGTAGQPILDVLRKRDLRRTAIVVTRYFGGIKLGAGGLVGAYSGTAAQAVASAKISSKCECRLVRIEASYPDYPTVETCVRRGGYVVDNISYGDGVQLDAYIPLDDVGAFEEGVREATAGRARLEIADEVKYVKR